MANTVKIKQSAVSAKIPTEAQLEQGELAINTLDRKLYSKDSSGTVFEFTDTITTSASDLTSGTLADARFPATLPAISGANLTNLPASGASDIDGLADGYYAGYSVGLGSGAFGNLAGANSFSVAVGLNALRYTTSGTFNSALGYAALNNSVSGSANAAFGAYALTAATTGGANTAMGRDALKAVTTGTVNIGFGAEAGRAITTGSNNTVIGQLAGTSALSSTVLIGAGATERLKIDSTGLYVNGSATALGGVNITSATTAPTNPAVGDQWYDTANGILYVRVTDGADEAWLDISSANGAAASAEGGGDLVKIATQSFDGVVTSLTFADCFNDTYDYYQVVLSQLENDSGGWAEFYGLLSSDSGSTWHSDYGYIDTSQTKLRFGGVDFGSDPLYQLHGNFMITGARDTDAFTTNIGQIMKMTNTGVSSYPIDIRNTLKSKAAVDTITFYPSSGTMDRGTITIYGLKG
jgi:hypothetical protein